MKKQFLKLCCLVCLFVPILLAGQETYRNEQDLKKLNQFRLTQPTLNKAFDLLDAKDWEGATRQFNRCLEVLPAHPNACFGLANILNQKGDFIQALTWIEKAEKGSLDFKQIWANQKLNLLKLSQEEQDSLRQIAFELQFKYEKAACNAAKFEQMSKNASEKAKNMSVKGNTDNSPFDIPVEFFALHGDLLFKLKRVEEAEAQYLQALNVVPNHERSLNNLINIYYISHKLEQAQGWLEKAGQQKVEINPGLVQAIKQAELAQKTGN